MFVDVVDDEESSVVNSEPDVEYTEVVHPQPVDPNRGKNTHMYSNFILFGVHLFWFCTFSISIFNILTKTIFLRFAHIPL